MDVDLGFEKGRRRGRRPRFWGGGEGVDVDLALITYGVGEGRSVLVHLLGSFVVSGLKGL